MDSTPAFTLRTIRTKIQMHNVRDECFNSNTMIISLICLAKKCT